MQRRLKDFEVIGTCSLSGYILPLLLLPTCISDCQQIPLLVVIMLAMLYNRVPQLWYEANKLLSSLSDRSGDRIVEVL